MCGERHINLCSIYGYMYACIIFNKLVLKQVSGIPSRCLMEMDDPSSANVRRLTKIADDMLNQPSMEHIPFGGKRQLQLTNKERLDHFVDCLIAEHRARQTEFPRPLHC